MSIEAQFVRVMRQNLNDIATAASLPIQVTLTAASGWCAPAGPGQLRESIQISDFRLDKGGIPRRTLACGCAMDILETGWHETGCEIVGEHLCRPATRLSRAGRLLPVAVYSA